MSKFRKKPVVIDAVQWLGDFQALIAWRSQWPDYSGQNGDGFHFDLGGIVAIETLEGEMTARRGDWIIRGVKGEFYPCKPDIFAATYELVAASPDPDAETSTPAARKGDHHA